MIFWYFLLIVSFVWILFATVTDLRTREVPNWLNYSLIALGFGARIIYSFILKDWSYFLYGLLGFILFFIFANFMYYTKQWGGGDCKLLMGLGVIFMGYTGVPLFSAIHRLPFLLTLIINIFIAGAIYGFFYSLYLALNNWNNFKQELLKLNLKWIKFGFLIFFFIIFFSYFLLPLWIFYLTLSLLLFLMFSLCVLYFIKTVETTCLYKYLPVTSLTEGDWLAENVVKHEKIICTPRNIGLTKKDILLLKKHKIKQVFVKEGIPFVPGFLFGFILSIVFGDLLFFFI